MAASRGMKPFYIGLVTIAAIGAGGIWYARTSVGTGGPVEIGLVPVAAGSFSGYTIGNEDAPVEIIEYADFECPACAQFAILSGPDVKSRLVAGGQVRWTFRDFPLTNIHPNAMSAHNAAACANDQGRFWEMHDLLYFRHSQWVRERRPERRFRDFADELGIDGGQFRECLDSRRYVQQIEATRQNGLELGVSSTPTFIIGNLRVSGDIGYDSLKVLVERAATQPQ